MQPIPAQALIAGATFKIDLQAINPTNNPVKGAVLQNLSGFVLTVTNGGDSWTLPAGTNDYITLVPISGGLLTVTVGPVNASPSLPGPVLTGTLYETGDPTPVGYPMVNPGFLQVPPPGSQAVVPSTSASLIAGSNFIQVPGQTPSSAFFSVAGMSTLMISDEFLTDATGISVIVSFYTAPNFSNNIGRPVQWNRSALNATALHWMVLPVQGAYFTIQVLTNVGNTIIYSIFEFPNQITQKELIPAEQVIQAGTAGLTIAANSQANVFPSEYPGPGRFRASVNFGSTGSAFPSLPIVDQGVTVTVPASGSPTVLAAPAAGFQNRIKRYEFHANTTAFAATSTYTITINSANVDVQYYQATGLAGEGTIDIVTTGAVTMSNSGATAGQASVVYDVEPIPIIARLATMSGNGNPQIAGTWIIDMNDNEFEFIAPVDDWFLYLTNESGSPLTVSVSAIGPL